MILVNRFKSKMAAKYLDFDRSLMIQVVIIDKKYISVLKMTEQYKLTICVRLM